MDPVEIGKHLVIDPRVCFGKLTFKGTRVPVETVLVSLTEGRTIKSILGSWPYLKREAVEEAIQLAAVAWPEMMQEKSAERIQALAKGLKVGSKKRVNRSREPAHIGRST
jgi:uncharacterized protein (DUF433 family)